MRIIILDHEPFNERKKKHYFIDSFIEDNIKVEYWSLVDCLGYTNGLNYNYREQEYYVTYIRNKSQLIDKIKEIENDKVVFIVEFWLKFSSFYIFKELYNRGLKWVRLDYYSRPLIPFSIIPSFRDKLSEIRITNLGRKVESFFTNFFLRHRKETIPHILFLTGKTETSEKAKNRTVSLNYFDVEEYNKIKDKKRLLDEKYIVFLDTMLVDHPDIEAYGYTKGLNEHDYFEKINLFFDFIEDETGFEVVIAAHPKSNYSSEFGKRKVLKGVTSQLVNHCEGVFTHGSTSLTFALLSSKPAYLLYSSTLFRKNEFLESVRKNMNVIADNLQIPIIDIDKPTGFSYLNNVNKVHNHSVLSNYFLSNVKDSNYFIFKKNIISLFE